MKPTSRVLSLLLAAICLFSVCACGSHAYRNDLSSVSVLDTVTAAVTAEDGYAAVEGSYINASAWGEDYTILLEAVSDYRIVISDRADMNIDEIGVFHVENSSDVRDVERIVKEYLTAQQTRYKDLLQSYNPDELPKSENGKVTVCGQYILYTILDDDATAAAHEAFEGALKAD